MKKVLTIILIITLILCILGSPFIFNYKGSTTFKRNVNHVVTGSANIKQMFFDVWKNTDSAGNVTSMGGVAMYFEVFVDWDYFTAIENSYNYSQAHLVFTFLEDIDDTTTITHQYVLVSMPCYYYLDYKKMNNDNSITYSVSSLAIAYDFIYTLKSLSAFEYLSEIYDILDRIDYTSHDLEIEVLENIRKFFIKTDLFFKYTKFYFNFFTLKGVE